MAENIHEQNKHKAIERLRATLELPDASRDDIGPCEGEFNPWELFPALLGAYSGEFDQCAIAVLLELQDRVRRRGDLAAEMFQEMLCTGGFCEYGTSPRACFPTPEFKALLPTLIERWTTYAKQTWGDDVI